jgi:cytochrome P450
LDPYPYYEQFRELGPVIWLSKYNIYALARHKEVSETLADWENFSSAAGVGLANFNTEKPWRKPSILLEVDPPYHTKTRSAINKILNRVALSKLKAGFEEKAKVLIDDLLTKKNIDGVKDLAEVFPLRVFPDAVGIDQDGRENLLPFGNMAFNAFGPPNKLRQDSLKEAEQVLEWVMSRCQREALSQDGLGAQLYEMADTGRITSDEAGMLVRSLLTAGLDTTVYGIANALFSFASFPQQWQKLKQNPDLLKYVFDEVVRVQSPVQTFFRTTSAEVTVADTRIPKDQKVLMFLGSANRDPRKWQDPDQFDIERRAIDHVGFGAGVHKCVGQMMSKLEAEVIFSELIKRVDKIELNGLPERKLNNTLRGFKHLPITLHS